MEFMAYSGKYKVKNPQKYKGDPSKVVYRSMWERNAFYWCENNPEIKEWSSEEVIIPYYYDVDKKYHRYFMDLRITYNDNRTILVEIKPAKETAPPKKADKSKRYLNEAFTYIKNQNKWKAAGEYAKDRGWTFEIWTEHTLEAKGINHKALKPLKKITPLKPLRKPKKK
jgi:hypothetical protein